MNKTTLRQAAVILASIALVPANAITVHTIGDSTMANYNEETTEQRGWGQMLQQFFTNGATINNRGKSGASSKSFYLEAPYWTTVKQQIATGDYVLIQFAHNDEKNGGLDGDTVIARTGDSSTDYRGTTAQGTYKTYLRNYVNETRTLGATPILVAPMCRKYFTGNTIRRNGRHDLGDKFNIFNADNTLGTSSVAATDHTYDYPYAMQEIATEMNVPYIDLTTLSAALFESYGETACTNLLFMSTDGTHPTALGGTLIARLVVQELAAQNILTEYLNQSADLLINPTSVDFGEAYSGQTLTKEVSLSGFDLTPVNGTFILQASSGFEISASRTEGYAASIQLPYTDGNLTFTRIYIRCQLTIAGVLNGTLNISNDSISKAVPLTATGIELTGGERVLLNWPLATDNTYTLTGPATAVDQSFSNMITQRYAIPNAATVWPEGCGYDATHATQRNFIDNEGNVWPAGEIDEVSNRYIQFGIQANAGTELHIDSIGLYICGAGGNGMRCRIWYLPNDDFSEAQTIADFSGSMVSNTMYAVSATPVLKLNAGQKMLLRIFPWYNGGASGKTICLSDVVIRGVAGSATAIKQTTNDKKPLHIRYFAFDGRCLSQCPTQGGCIQQTVFTDGSIQVIKQIR